ncbi:MAG: hypothetical protein M1358_06375 [Chloroflexi bacterium]|nr:hypothetical protein [Chloroflexota bacterium]
METIEPVPSKWWNGRPRAGCKTNRATESCAGKRGSLNENVALFGLCLILDLLVFFPALSLGQITASAPAWSPPSTTAQLLLRALSAPWVRLTGEALLAAVSAALACVVLNHIFSRWRIAPCWRYPLLTLFALNPLILLNIVNTAPETTSLLLVVLAVNFLLAWHSDQNLQALAALGFTLGLAWVTRVETVPYALPILGVLWILARSGERTSSDRVQALLITCLVPAMFIVGAWVLWDWLIARDTAWPVQHLSFDALRLAQQLNEESRAILASAGKWQAMPSSVSSLVGFMPFFILGVGLSLVDYLLTRNRISLSLAVLALTLPGLQIVSPFLGGNGHSWRNFTLTVPFGLIASGHVISRAAGTGNRKIALVVSSLLLLVLGASSIASGLAVAPSREQGRQIEVDVRNVKPQLEVPLERKPATSYWCETPSRSGGRPGPPGAGRGTTLISHRKLTWEGTAYQMGGGSERGNFH